MHIIILFRPTFQQSPQLSLINSTTKLLTCRKNCLLWMKIVCHLICDSFVLTCTLSWAVDLSSRACSWFKWSMNIPSWCPLPSSNLSLQPGQRQDPWLSRGWGWPLLLFPEGDVRVGEWGWVGVGGDRIDSAPSVIGLVLPLVRRWWWWLTFSPLIWKWNASGCRL